MTQALNSVLNCLPFHIATAIETHLKEQACHEIRLIRNKKVTVKSQQGLAILNVVSTSKDIDGIIEKLCSYSLYAHEETIKRGYISFSHGVRIGVCGTAVSVNGQIQNIKEINCLNIRIPASIPSVCQPVLHALEHYNFHGGLLVFSPPGIGKTTLLRHTAIALSTSPYLKRVSLIDSRGELSIGCENSITLDIYKHYPPSQAIEMAIRTMSPEIIICDEIGGEEEENAIIASANKGVTVLASAHGDDICSLMKNRTLKKLHETGIFSCYCQLSRPNDRLIFKFICAEEITA